MSERVIAVAGATGHLGDRVVRSLLGQGASVRAIVRRETTSEKKERLQALGASVVVVEMRSQSDLEQASAGASCVVSTLQGLYSVIVEAQSALLKAAERTGVRRFIPSDYSLDFTKLPVGSNRNLDLRREFHKVIEATPAVAATTIFNGAFTDLLTGQMPLVLPAVKTVLYWGDADQRMDFTTMDDTAEFTARVALQESTPRFLYIAADQISARELAALMLEITGQKYHLVRAGGLKMLDVLIRAGKAVNPADNNLFPAWQGMQYMHNMFDGRGSLGSLDNNRFPDIRWTSVREVLSASRS